MQPQSRCQDHWQQQQQQQPGGAEGMDTEGGTGPGPPGPSAVSTVAAAAAEQEQFTRLATAAEGASYVCRRCGGLVAVARQAAHEQSWCPSLQGGLS